MELGQKISDFAKDAHSLYKKLEKFERVKFLKIIVSNSTLKNGILDVELKKPFDALVKIRKNERTYPQLDNFRTSLFNVPFSLELALRNYHKIA